LIILISIPYKLRIAKRHGPQLVVTEAEQAKKQTRENPYQWHGLLLLLPVYVENLLFSVTGIKAKAPNILLFAR
jgi:hypothetical protein